MKKYFFTFLCICFSSILTAQIHELGVLIGGTNYVGDVGSTSYINPNKVGIGLIYKWNLNPRIALRATGSFLTISANDVNSDNLIRKQRGRSFSNNILEAAAGMEYNFFEYDLSSKHKTFTPYILVEMAAINYKTLVSKNPNTFTDKGSFAIPFGVGYKSKLLGKLAFAAEVKFRYTFGDDLDYTIQSNSSLSSDWYVFTGFSLVYTFGRPACYASF